MVSSRRSEAQVELSIREVKARFAEVAAAAARGERVVVTKHGHPFIELVPAQTQSGMDFGKAAQVQKALGLDGITVTLPPDFDDPAFSRKVLDLPE
jgi:prevent-host-death family protein